MLMSDSSYITTLQRFAVRGSPGEPEEAEPLPAIDAPYKAFSRRSNQEEFAIHFITPAGTMRSFEYVDLDSDSSYTAECITLYFGGRRMWKVMIHGRRLREAYGNIHQRRISWVREAEREFVDDEDDQPFVAKVGIEPITSDG
jgi:hypothetical protein